MPTSVLIGGVGQLYQSDLDLGRVAAEQLRGAHLGDHVVVEDLHYGAVAVAQRLQELRPDTLVLIGAVEARRPPGTVRRRRIREQDLCLGAERLQGAVADAVTGYVTIDLVVEVAHALGALPDRVVAIEVEPEVIGPGDALSAGAMASLDRACALAIAEAGRAPLLRLAGDLREGLEDGHLEDGPGVHRMRGLLEELGRLDQDGRWGRTFSRRDRLRQLIATADTPAGMTHLDWSLWWSALEEIDRLQAVESVSPPGS